MQRIAVVLFIVLVLVASALGGRDASASPCFCLFPAQSSLELEIGDLPQVRIQGDNYFPGPRWSFGSQGNPTLGFNIIFDPQGSFTPNYPTIWSTVNLGPGTSLFTGVPLISNLKITVREGPGILQSGAFASATSPLGPGFLSPSFGGILRLNGTAVVHAMAGAINLPIPLSHVGGGLGETTMQTLLGNNITVTFAPFAAGTWRITDITTNVITIPARGNVQGVAFTLQPTPGETAMTPSTNGGFVSISGGLPIEQRQVTVAGSYGSGSPPQQVAVISPMRIDTGAIAGRIPGLARLNLVPEPGGLLLLASGALGLAWIGHRSRRR